MADIGASELEAAVERIVADNQEARQQGRNQAAKLMELLSSAPDPQEFSDVVADITDRAVRAVEQPALDD